MQLLDALIEYFSEVTGSNILPEEMPGGRSDLLPVFLSQKYQLYSVKLFSKDYVLLIQKGGEKPTPSQAENHSARVNETLKAEAVFVFSKLDSYVRKRFVDKGIPFIVPYQHLFLPMVFMDFREQTSRGQDLTDDGEKVTTSAQVLLLYYFHHHEMIGDWSLTRWAEALEYSNMTISRAWKELAAKGLCTEERKGRITALRFPYSNKELWSRAMPSLRNPVRHKRSAKIVNEDKLKLCKAGLSALADRTLITEGPRKAYAMPLRAWKTAIEDGNLERASVADESAVTIETWRYNPSLISCEDKGVDSLSLYLSLKDVPDERVQGALREIVDEFPWK